jgi:nitrite reductase/ring-hydroxylating ferredoxin subunit
MALHKALTRDDLPPGSARAIEAGGRKIALFNFEGTIYAIDDECTHDRASLSEGTVSDGCVTCPSHGAQFDLERGAALTPPAVEGVRSYPVVITGNDVFIDLG